MVQSTHLSGELGMKIMLLLPEQMFPRVSSFDSHSARKALILLIFRGTHRESKSNLPKL